MFITMALLCNLSNFFVLLLVPPFKARRGETWVEGGGGAFEPIFQPPAPAWALKSPLDYAFLVGRSHLVPLVVVILFKGTRAPGHFRLQCSAHLGLPLAHKDLHIANHCCQNWSHSWNRT